MRKKLTKKLKDFKVGLLRMAWKTVLVTKDGLFSGFDTKSYCEESGIFPNWRLGRLNP